MRCLWIGLCCVAVGACGEVATPDYRGVPLATVNGFVENPEGLALPDDVNAYVVWLDAIGSGDAGELAASATVEATLPAKFSLSLFHEPPPVAFGSVADNLDVTVAVGTIVIATPKQLTALAEGRPVRGVYGATGGMVLAYAPSVGDAADLDAVFAGDAVSEGFNLVQTGETATVVPLSTQIVVGLVDGGSP